MGRVNTLNFRFELL